MELLQQQALRTAWCVEIGAWRLLVCCIMLNQQRRSQVDKVWPSFFNAWPDSVAASHARTDPRQASEMRELLQPLGLVSHRHTRILDLSQRWTEVLLHSGQLPEDVDDLPGCGKYANDSYRMFVHGDFDVEPDDKELRAYKQYAESING